MERESAIQRAIMDFFTSLTKAGYPVLAQKRQAGGFNYKHGIPDIYVVIDGKHFEIEVKSPNGKRRATQEKWEERFKSLHIPYLLVNDVDELKKIINYYLHRKNIQPERI